MVNGTLVGSPNVLLNPKLSMYQAVYGCSLVFILIVFVGETIFFAKVSKYYLVSKYSFKMLSTTKILSN